MRVPEDFAMYLALDQVSSVRRGGSGKLAPQNANRCGGRRALLGRVAGPTERTQHVLTGLDDRQENIVAFAAAALELLA